MTNFLSSCQVNEKKNERQSPDKEVKALSLTEFPVRRFVDANQNEKCDSINTFLQEFTDQYMEDVELKLGDCSSYSLDDEITSYQEFAFLKGEESLEFDIYVWDKGTAIQYQLTWEVESESGNKHETYAYREKDEKISPVLKFFVPTIEEWLKDEDILNTQTKIFNKDYFDLVNKVLDADYLFQSPAVKINILSKEIIGYNQVIGTLEFEEVDQELLNDTFLGCATFECFADSTISYRFVGPYFKIRRFISDVDGVKKYKEVSFVLKKDDQLIKN